MERFPELQILISEKKRESSFINKEEALERGLLFLCLYSAPMTVRGRPWSSGAGNGPVCGALGGLWAGDFRPPCFMYHERKEISPLRNATVEMTIGVFVASVISSGTACRYGADGKSFDDTLSREISRRNASCTMVA